MTQIIDYTVVTSQYQEVLSDRVKMLISKGWQPFGGIAVSNISQCSDELFYQAMVKYTDNNP